jgi:protein tyrosine/serine phosphatase
VRAFVLLFSALTITAAADLPATHIRNFDKVNEHIYRGGEPTAIGVGELGAMGVKTIIDLRQKFEGTEAEKQLAEKLKIQYINVPLSEFGAPAKGDMQHILALLETQDTIFVHCRRGKDRTGTVIACYRIEHDGWDNLRALREAKEHGMSSFERIMRSYILHFTPFTLGPVGSPGALAPAVAR